MTDKTRRPTARGYSYRRHPWPLRLMHWINVLAVSILLMSGLQIFNAHPSLYWGKSSYNGRPPVLRMRAEFAPPNAAPSTTAAAPAGGNRLIGTTEILGRKFDTSGVLGASAGSDGRLVQRGFPSWATLPGEQWLSMGRQWHFAFAWLFVLNGIAYLVYTIASRHLVQDLAPKASEWRTIGASILQHLMLKHPQGDAARSYNILQKLVYLVVIFALLPLIALFGWAMSPWMDSIVTGWIDVFGGRQSARTLHFIAATLIVLFVLVHVFEVIVTGLWNNLRSMITGRYEIRTADSEVPSDAK
jgi:thiosulfate reductase cytochrome b subunit